MRKISSFVGLILFYIPFLVFPDSSKRDEEIFVLLLNGEGAVEKAISILLVNTSSESRFIAAESLNIVGLCSYGYMMLKRFWKAQNLSMASVAPNSWVLINMFVDPGEIDRCEFLIPIELSSNHDGFEEIKVMYISSSGVPWVKFPANIKRYLSSHRVSIRRHRGRYAGFYIDILDRSDLNQKGLYSDKLSIVCKGDIGNVNVEFLRQESLYFEGLKFFRYRGDSPAVELKTCDLTGKLPIKLTAVPVSASHLAKF